MTMCISEALSMPIEFDSMHHRDAGVQNEKSDATAYSPASTSSQSDFVSVRSQVFLATVA